MSRFTEEDREAVNEILARRDGTGVPSMMQIVERIADRAARAAERALVERIEAVLREIGSISAYRRSQSMDDAAAWAFDHSAELVRAALRPEAATTEGACCKTEMTEADRAATIEADWREQIDRAVAAEQRIGAVITLAERALSKRYDLDPEDVLAAARPSSTRGGDDAAAVRPDTEGERHPRIPSDAATVQEVIDRRNGVNADGSPQRQVCKCWRLNRDGTHERTCSLAARGEGEPT